MFNPLKKKSRRSDIEKQNEILSEIMALSVQLGQLNMALDILDLTSEDHVEQALRASKFIGMIEARIDILGHKLRNNHVINLSDYVN